MIPRGSVAIPDKDDGERELDAAYARLQQEIPSFLARLLAWLRNPEAARIRLPLGILLVALSFFSFLPVIGIEFLPLGLLIIAVDVPLLRKPVARAVVWSLERWIALRRWWQRKPG